MSKAKRPLECEVMASVAEAIKLLGLDIHRQNTGAARLPGKGGKMRLYRFGRPGDSDYSGILPGGRRIDLEVKRPGEKPNDLQLQRLAKTNAAGGVGVWIDDGARAYGILKSLMEGARIEVDEAGKQWVVWPDKEIA